MYTSPTGVTGLNVTAAVLGPLDITDRVELVYDLGSDTTRTTFGEPLRMTYRAPLEASPYNVSDEVSNALLSKVADLASIVRSTMECECAFRFYCYACDSLCRP